MFDGIMVIRVLGFVVGAHRVFRTSTGVNTKSCFSRVTIIKAFIRELALGDWVSYMKHP